MSNNKLEPGDLAIVIKSASGKSLGKIVECVKTDGEHSQLGLMWIVKSNSPLKTIGGDVLTQVHVPQDWLRKIPKDPLPEDEEIKELEMT